MDEQMQAQETTELQTTPEKLSKGFLTSWSLRKLPGRQVLASATLAFDTTGMHALCADHILPIRT